VKRTYRRFARPAAGKRALRKAACDLAAEAWSLLVDSHWQQARPKLARALAMLEEAEADEPDVKAYGLEGQP
jgi:hypothetical protein